MSGSVEVPSPLGRQSWLTIDISAISDNVAALREMVAPSELCAVVKADGYGHGALPAARAARRGGASWFGVALVEEGIELRAGDITEPVLVLSEQPATATWAALDAGLTVTVASRSGLEAIAGWTQRTGREAAVHLKVNTGMNRMGAELGDAPGLARAISSTPGVRLGGTFTHLACADDPDPSVTDRQLAAFERFVVGLRTDGIDPGVIHAANSAAAIAAPRARFDLVRVGIAIYGIAPAVAMSEVAAEIGLRPALSLETTVTAVRRVAAGEGISYGHAAHTGRETTIATVAVGYADGVARRSGVAGGVVLVRGVRTPMIGVVTMDQTMIDCGNLEIEVGEPVVVIGAQGGEVISANEIGERLSTIGYEVVCGLSRRLPRRYVG